MYFKHYKYIINFESLNNIPTTDIQMSFNSIFKYYFTFYNPDSDYGDGAEVDAEAEAEADVEG